MHDFRRTAIRNMVRAGIPKHTAMQLSGHRTASVFDRYDIHDLQDLEEATATLAQSHGNSEPACQTSPCCGSVPEPVCYSSFSFDARSTPSFYNALTLRCS